MYKFLKKFWKWIVGIVIGAVALFILWQLRKRENELIALRARITQLQQELREKEALLKIATNAADIETLKADIAHREKAITELSAQYTDEKKFLQERIDRVSKAQTWDDLK